MKKFKTLLITNDYPPVVSGISTVFYQVWKLLDSSDHYILTPKVPQCKEFDRNSGLKPIRHPAINSSGKAAKLINSIIQFLYVLYFILWRRVKIIHAGQIWISGTIGYIAKKLLGIPYILWVYGGETQEVYMSNLLTTFWAKTLLKNAEKLVTNSKFCQREFLDYGFSPEKCPIVLPGVDPEVFTPGAPPSELIKRWNPEGKQVLITVARISERKGHDLVIKSLPRILVSHPNTIYLIVGKGPDKLRLEKLAAELGVSRAVKFCGFVPDEELPDYYRLCDVYVMPNREIFDSTDSIEGFGISFVEASACAKPVIGGKSGGALESVADGYSGLLVNPDSVDEFTDSVLKILNDDEYRIRLGKQGRKRVEEQMNWRSRAQTVLDIEKG